jgi:hypothetical protein
MLGAFGAALVIAEKIIAVPTAKELILATDKLESNPLS